MSHLLHLWDSWDTLGHLGQPGKVGRRGGVLLIEVAGGVSGCVILPCRFTCCVSCMVRWACRHKTLIYYIMAIYMAVYHDNTAMAEVLSLVKPSYICVTYHTLTLRRGCVIILAHPFVVTCCRPVENIYRTPIILN